MTAPSMASIYLLESCPGQCLEGNDVFSGPDAFEYTNDTGSAATFFIVGDRFGSNTEPYTYELVWSIE